MYNLKIGINQFSLSVVETSGQKFTVHAHTILELKQKAQKTFKFGSAVLDKIEKEAFGLIQYQQSTLLRMSQN